MPAAHRPEQTAPRPASPTAITNGRSRDPDARAQSGDFPSTAQGLRGAAAHGVFEPRGTASSAITAGFLGNRGTTAEVLPGVDAAGEIDNTIVANLVAALGLHWAWDRAAKAMSATAPPAK